MSGPRSISLRIFLGRHGATYALTHRTVRGDDHFDRRLDSGLLRYSSGFYAPPDVLALLARALLDLQERHGVQYVARASASGPPGGLQGRLAAVPPVDLDDFSDRDTRLDKPLPGL